MTLFLYLVALLTGVVGVQAAAGAPSSKVEAAAARAVETVQVLQSRGEKSRAVPVFSMLAMPHGRGRIAFATYAPPRASAGYWPSDRLRV